MTRDEVMQRMIYKEATPRKDRAMPINIRKRGNNFVPKDEPHPSEAFDDFFDYEREMSDLTPARETVSDEIDSYTPYEEIPSSEPEESVSGFIVMEKLPTQKPKINNIVTTSDNQNDDNKKLPFEFIRCEFLKDNGERCKKQAKKGQQYCGIHRRFLAKSENSK